MSQSTKKSFVPASSLFHKGKRNLPFGKSVSTSFTAGSSIDSIQKVTQSTKEGSSKVVRSKINKERFNLVVQFLSANKPFQGKNGETSKKRKVLVQLPNLSSANIPEDAAGYVFREDTDPHTIYLMSSYNKASLTLWKDLDKEFPLSEEDFMILSSHNTFYISIPEDAAITLSPGDFITLYDVTLSVYVPREDLKGFEKLSEISDSEKEWKGKRIEKKDKDGNMIVVEVKPRNPRFNFNAGGAIKLPSVSVEALIKMYQDQGFLTTYLDPSVSEVESAKKVSNGDSFSDSKHDRDDGDNKESEEDSFRMDKRWFKPVELFRFFYDASYIGEGGASLFPTPDGNLLAFELFRYPDECLSENDKYDMTKIECVKTRNDPNNLIKCWCFNIRGIQRIFGKSSDPKHEATGGYDTVNPVVQHTFSIRMDVYKETLEQSFSIINKEDWMRFISCYGDYFKGVFTCMINKDKTNQKMDRLKTLSGATSDKPFDFALEFNCKGIEFSYREMVNMYGIPVRPETACDLMDLLEQRRKEPSLQRRLAGSVSSVNELPSYRKQAVACLNEIDKASVSKQYITTRGTQCYVMLIPSSRELMNSDNIKTISEIDSVDVGDNVVRNIYFTEKLDSSKCSEGLQELCFGIKALGYAKQTMSLVFAVGEIYKDFYDAEATTISKFIGVEEERKEQVKAWLAGKEIPDQVEKHESSDPSGNLSHEDKKDKGKKTASEKKKSKVTFQQDHTGDQEVEDESHQTMMSSQTELYQNQSSLDNDVEIEKPTEEDQPSASVSSSKSNSGKKRSTRERTSRSTSSSSSSGKRLSSKRQRTKRI